MLSSIPYSLKSLKRNSPLLDNIIYILIKDLNKEKVRIYFIFIRYFFFI